MQQPRNGLPAVSLTRIRYQNGSVELEPRKVGGPVWIYRWRETGPDGRRTRRKRIIGTKAELPTKAAAKRAVEGLRLDINAETGSSVGTQLTVGQLIEHYRKVELGEKNKKTVRTTEVYVYQLMKVIAPKWGNFPLNKVSPVAVEAWLEEFRVAPGTKAKTKGVLSVIFKHAMRYGWATANPIQLVRQTAMPLQEKVVLTAVEVAALLAELRDPFRALVLLAAVTGLRRGELFGLKWEDVNFSEKEISIVRSMVDQIEGPPKTLASRRPIPMSRNLASALQAWRDRSDFAGNTDWVFASPNSIGAKPYWPDAVLKRHLLPAANRAGIAKKIGWHTFRRTLATLLQSSGASVKTTQELLRHASPIMTLGTYAKAVTADKRIAQDAIAAMFVGKP